MVDRTSSGSVQDLTSTIIIISNGLVITKVPSKVYMFTVRGILTKWKDELLRVSFKMKKEVTLLLSGHRCPQGRNLLSKMKSGIYIFFVNIVDRYLPWTAFCNVVPDPQCYNKIILGPCICMVCDKQ